MSETEIRWLLEDIAGTDVSDPDWSKSDLRAILARHAESAKAALTAQPASGAQQASAWTTVTDDPASLPGARVLGKMLAESAKGNRYLLNRFTFMHVYRTRNIVRWMEWPSPLSPPDGMRELRALCKEAAESMATRGFGLSSLSRDALIARLRAGSGS